MNPGGKAGIINSHFKVLTFAMCWNRINFFVCNWSFWEAVMVEKIEWNLLTYKSPQTLAWVCSLPYRDLICPKLENQSFALGILSGDFHPFSPLHSTPLLNIFMMPTFFTWVFSQDHYAEVLLWAKSIALSHGPLTYSANHQKCLKYLIWSSCWTKVF